MGASRLATVGWAFTMQQQELYLFTTSTQLTFIKKPPTQTYRRLFYATQNREII